MPATIKTPHRIERNGYRLTIDSQVSHGVAEYGWWIYRMNGSIPHPVKSCGETWGDFEGANEAGMMAFAEVAK